MRPTTVRIAALLTLPGALTRLLVTDITAATNNVMIKIVSSQGGPSS
jgi:hypothetical protein